jgi:hypothetical protein
VGLSNIAYSTFNNTYKYTRNQSINQLSMMTITEAREEVSKCDQEIQSIKAALRGIGNVNSSETNELKIEFSKVRIVIFIFIFICICVSI